ncbi:GTP-binding protein TypA/BipA [Tetrabaena socialis]|uniref:GTP-binding protein TypA/BipA n=1 Tax=Tetrabaena socialis TaxID=47790 RepID=A0A2J7ZRL1_9CHLO|nr:GTP-binding protein TypA/BipA [Tetrabaena socialis]|eukprot:PNH02909.1 GTP-binding protein TypA/BipA [Tetrabaena socialis]
MGRVDPPTLAMVFGPNDSPLAGRAGKALTGRAIGERLQAEAETSVSLRVQPVEAPSKRTRVSAAPPSSQVNCVKGKKLTNVRSLLAEEKVSLTAPRLMTLEDAIGYVGPDELIEVTPAAIRLRKETLDAGLRRVKNKRQQQLQL